MVIVSIYLARRDKNIRLEVSAGHRLLVTPGVKGPHPEYVCIMVVNIGHREAQITGIGWKIGMIKKQHAIQTTSIDGLSSQLPIRLKDGEEAKYFTKLDKDKQWIKDFAKDMLVPYSKLRRYFIKVQVYTSVGKTFESRIEKGLREMLVESMTGHNRISGSFSLPLSTPPRVRVYPKGTSVGREWAIHRDYRAVAG